MKVLIGTTNPSKVKRFEQLLAGCDIEFCTLKDLGITQEPEESGKNPEENAIIKAKYYGKFFDIVICNDSRKGTISMMLPRRILCLESISNA